MKKSILIGAAMMLFAPVFAQKKNVKDAAKALSEAQKVLALKQFDLASTELNKAKDAINLATQDASTSNEWDTWYYKAVIYGKMQEVPTLAESKPYKTSHEALQKALQLDKNKVEGKKDEFANLVSNLAFQYFNDGVLGMQGQQYANAKSDFDQSYELLNYNNVSLLTGNKQIDTIKAQALMYSGFSAHYAEDYNTAVANLKKATANPIGNAESNVYIILSNAYSKLGDKTNQLATINEARKKFPNDANVLATEINYYIDNDQSEQMIATLEKSIGEEPSRDDYYYNLAFAYQSLANKNEGKADEELYWNKASDAFKKALELKPANTDYGYNAGVSFFNRGKIINDKMNALGTTAADNKKYDAFKVQRDALFEQSIPYFENVRTIFAGRDLGKMNNADKVQYHQTLSALQQIYALQNKMDKVNEMKAAKDLLK